MKKITVTLDEDKVGEIKKLVSSGQCSSVSGFVQHAVAIALDDVAGWQSILTRTLEATGGPLTAKERRWADEMLGLDGTGKAPAA